MVAINLFACILAAAVSDFFDGYGEDPAGDQASGFLHIIHCIVRSATLAACSQNTYNIRLRDTLYLFEIGRRSSMLGKTSSLASDYSKLCSVSSDVRV